MVHVTQSHLTGANDEGKDFSFTRHHCDPFTVHLDFSASLNLRTIGSVRHSRFSCARRSKFMR